MWMIIIIEFFILSQAKNKAFTVKKNCRDRGKKKGSQAKNI